MPIAEPAAPRGAVLTSSNTTALGRRGGGAAYDNQVALDKKQKQEARRALLQENLPAQALPTRPVARSLGEGFPNVDVLDGDTCDELLPPTKAYTAKQALSELEKWRARRFQTPKEVVEFLLALNSVNATNTYLVSLSTAEGCNAILTSRPSQIAYRC